jgi:arylsulfatase A-like enzyme
MMLSLVACSTRPVPQPTAARPPNVLFIAIDDLRPTIGAYGDPIVKTPNIDRLARSGAVFLEAHAQEAVCNPSRASLLTGLRPDSLRVWDLETDFRRTTPNVVTLPQYFIRNGYAAVSVGKIYHNMIPDSLSWSEPEYKVPGFPYDPDAVYHGHESVSIQEIRKAALIRAGREASAIDRFGQWYLKANATEREDLPDSAYYDGAQTDYAVRRLAALRDTGRPFFFAVGYYRPHLPFNAPKRYWDRYNPDSLPLAPNQMVPAGAPGMAVNTNRELRGYADFADAEDPADGHLTPADVRRLTHGYYASISYIDAQVGRLLDQIDALGLAENTIVVLWGDNGFKLGEHNGWAKMTNYTIDTHVPLIIRAPGQIRPGLRLPQPVELVDIYPTLSELAGLPLPSHLQGASAVPLLNNPERSWKGAVFSQYLRRDLGGEGQHPVHGILDAHRRLPLRRVDELDHPPIRGVGVVRSTNGPDGKRESCRPTRASRVARQARGRAIGGLARGDSGEVTISHHRCWS